MRRCRHYPCVYQIVTTMCPMHHCSRFSSSLHVLTVFDSDCIHCGPSQPNPPIYLYMGASPSHGGRRVAGKSWATTPGDWRQLYVRIYNIHARLIIGLHDVSYIGYPYTGYSCSPYWSCRWEQLVCVASYSTRGCC